jgi:shikimate kinase
MTKKSTAQKSYFQKNIFLVGMPAVGKTYWGEKIAAELKLPFIDLDVFVADQEKASVSALFAMYGEKGFREREEKYLKKIIKTTEPVTIIACGGGTPCFGDNMKLMKDAGVVIYLQANTALLLQHLEAETEARPLLNNRGDLGTYLADMLEKRRSFYEQAHHILQMGDISRATFEQIISHE